MVEVVTAILIVTGVVLVMYTTKIATPGDIGEMIYKIQVRILNDISSQDNLRGAASNEDVQTIAAFVEVSLYDAGASILDYDVKICNIADLCNSERARSVVDKEVYVEEIIISGDLNRISPKKVRLFVWEK